MTHALGDRSLNPLIAEVEALQSVLHQLSEGVIIADRDGKFIIYNNVARSVLALGTMEESPRSWREVDGCYQSDGVTPYQPQELPPARALAGETVSETEIFIRNARRPAGVWIVAQASPLRNEARELCGSVMVFRDITGTRETNAQILMLTHAVEQTADSIVITDRNGLIEYVNPAFEITTGYQLAEIHGQSLRFLKSGVHDAAFYKKLWATILSGNVVRQTITNRKKSGEIYFAEQTITPMRDSTGKITNFVSVIKDVTEQKKLQEQQIQMNLARSVQQQFYKIAPPEIEGFDLAGAAFPADATGGDYFDFVPLPESCLGIVIGDVSGHGMSSALLMVELRAYLRAFALKSSNVDEIFSMLNRALTSDMEGDRYATLAFCVLHPGTKSFVYASAGHVPGYILNADGAIRQTLDSTDLPLGIMPEHIFSSGIRLSLEPGEVLALLTDGILEAERPDEEPFGVGRALDFIRLHRRESAQQIIAGLYRAVRDFTDGMPQTDDITAVVCKATDP